MEREVLEALDLINRVTSTFSGTRQDHINIQEALGVLQDFVKKHTQCDNSEEDDTSEDGVGDQEPQDPESSAAE